MCLCLRGTAAAAFIGRHQTALPDIELPFLYHDPFVETMPAQGLALRLRSSGRFFESDDVSHETIRRLSVLNPHTRAAKGIAHMRMRLGSIHQHDRMRVTVCQHSQQL